MSHDLLGFAAFGGGELIGQRHVRADFQAEGARVRARVFGDEDRGHVRIPFVPLADVDEGVVGVERGGGDGRGGVDGEEAAFGDGRGWAGAAEKRNMLVRWLDVLLEGEDPTPYRNCCGIGGLCRPFRATW